MRVVAAVIRAGDKFLACRRASGHDLAGKWEFPGGKVESGEEDVAALTREISEELDVQVLVGKLITKSSASRGIGTIEMFSYFATLEGPSPTQSSDHDLLEWVAVEDLVSLDWAELDIPVVDELIRLGQFSN